jgi:ABC-type lipoprotein export system ATPase subunit
MTARPVLLQLIGISKRFDVLQGGEQLEVLRDANLELSRGESLAVTGPSGSGKSTVLHIIGTLDRPTSGQVLLDGRDLSGLNDLELAAVRNRQIGFVFQSHFLLPQCTVFENVLVPTLAGHRASPNEFVDRAKQLLERVGLGKRLSHRPGQLSGGERQRVAVVRALINRPKLLLADEPTGALDRHSARELADLLVELNREQDVTLIVVTHALELAQRMGRMLQLADGRLGAATIEK